MPVPQLLGVLSGALLVAGPAARATPPDVSHSQVSVLCRGGDRLALLVRTHSNQGSHFISAVRFGLVQLDAAAGTTEGVVLSGIVDNHINAEGPDSSPERSRRSQPVDMGATLQAWGTESCGPVPRLMLPDAESGALRATVTGWADGGSPRLELVLGGRRRAVAGMRVLAAHAGDVEPGQPARTELYVDDPESLEVTVGEPVILETQAVVPVQVQEWLYGNTLFAVTARADFEAARAWLVNATGLDRHRAGRHKAAAHWFEAAARLDPSNPTPRFNRACAYAQLGDVQGTVNALALLRGVPGMRAKVAADSDFDGVRTHAAVKKAVAQLE